MKTAWIAAALGLALAAPSNFPPSGVRGYANGPISGRSRSWTRVSAGGASRAERVTAPEFAGIDRWLNSEPLTMRALRGKVVLVEFWTLACGNCLATLPHVAKWYDAYRDQGLVVVGVHTPETPEEAKPEAIANAVKRLDIRYPVAEDGAYATWKAYGNHYWPAVYLVDAQGRIAEHWFGEGSYYAIESSIRDLLRDARRAESTSSELD